MSRDIERSVGRNGHNAYKDTKTIQQMLNNVEVSSGGPEPKLDDDGDCGKLTKGAIFNFQLHNFGWKGADGRVDPGHATIIMLQIYDDLANEKKDPPKPKIPEPPKSHNTNKFIVRPAVVKTPFGQEDADWFFEIVAVPYQHTGIYYFQKRNAVRPLEPPKQFAKHFVILNTKFPRSPFEFPGQCVYATHDHSGTKHDRSVMLVKVGQEMIEIEWKINHLFGMTKQTGGTVSTGVQGEFVLIRRLINTAVL